MRIKLLFIALISIIQGASALTLDSLEVSFVNFYPGKDIYELEGHSALRIKYADSLDLAITYGMFDFDQPNFVYRFVKGETDYWGAQCDWGRFTSQYTMDSRSIVAHPLLLDSLQKARLLQIVAQSLSPENRVYRYNYVKDNCSLRPLRLVQAALGDSIILPEPTSEAAKDMTYRQVMRRYHKNYPWYQFGIDLALGLGIDKPISTWEKAFAPIVLDYQLEQATVAGRNLTSAPIVLFRGRDEVLPPTPWYLTPLFFSCIVLLIGILLTIRDVRKLKISKWFDALLFGAFGLCGIVLTFLIFISTHEATSPNWLYLWLNPLCLIIPALIWLKKYNNVILSYQIVNFALLLVMGIVWPFIGQSGNVAFVPLIACDMLRALNYIYVTIKTRKFDSK